MIPFNYHHLYYFFVIAKEGSIAKACGKLYLAQPTLSTQLKQFEKSLGRTLFRREKQRLVLTEEGRVVLGYAESIFGLGDELKDTLQDRPKIGRFAIQIGVLNGTPRSFAHALLEKVLDFAPNSEIHVHEASLPELVKDLKEHRVDVVLTDVLVRGPENDELHNQLVGKVPVVFAASPAVARRYRRFPDDLHEAPLVLPSSPSRVYQQILELMADWKAKPNIFAEVQDIELARRLALSGRGIAVLNAYTVAVSLPKNGLVVLDGSSQINIHESVYLVTRTRKVTNPLADHLLKNFQLKMPSPAVLKSVKRV